MLVVKYCSKCRLDKKPPVCPGYHYEVIEEEYCAFCGAKLKLISLTEDEMSVLKKCKVSSELVDAMVELKDKDIIEFETKMAQFRASAAQIKAAREEAKKTKALAEEEANKPKCPRCKSTNIQIIPRKWSFWAGVFTNKTDRVCANCKHKW